MMSTTHRLVLLRHGQSIYNLEGRFTGWTDSDLTDEGKKQARAAGRALSDAGYTFDIVYTSMLLRAIKTACLALDEMGQLWIPVKKSWRLNERHYGDLEGFKAEEAVRTAGLDQVRRWRRDLDFRPPPLAEGDPRDVRSDRRYSSHPVPHAESLREALDRLMPLWEGEIRESLSSGLCVLVVSHANLIRVLVRHLEGIQETDLSGIEVPSAKPLIYELDVNMRPTRRFFLPSSIVF